MKAKEYVEQYGDAIATGDNTALANLLSDMYKEVGDIIKSRNVKTDTAIVMCFEEMNTKFNSVASQIEKKVGFPVLRRNAFRNFSIERLPELKGFYNHKGIKV